MELCFSAMDEEAARQIVAWRYPPPYDIYNASGDPEEAVRYLLDPANRLYRIDSPQGLVAFCSFGADAQVEGGDYTQEALDLGLGVHPALTGQGTGSVFVSAQVQYALETFHPPALRVTIACFNQRARRVWEKAGFEWQQTFLNRAGTRQFDILLRRVNPPGE